jgi:hypothetical protein
VIRTRRSQYIVAIAVLLFGAAGLLRDRFATVLGATGMLRGRFVVDAPVSPEPFCPGGRSPSPNVVLCDNFEDTGFERRWDIGGHQGIWPTSEFVLCTDNRFGFHDRCAAWSNKLVFDREWGFYGYDGRRAFTPQSEFYVRWYQYIGDPFVWGTLEDKSVMLHDQANTLVGYVGTNRNHLPVVPDSGPGKPFVANYQDLDTPETGGLYNKVNRFQNQGRNITLQPGNWYLFEWYVKLNDPGVSNGVTRLWIDDAGAPVTKQTLRMEYTDMRWLRARDAGKAFGVVRLTVYHQRCEITGNTCPPYSPVVLAQSQRWDQLVISKGPIGPEQ